VKKYPTAKTVAIKDGKKVMGDISSFEVRFPFSISIFDRWKFPA
jgi:hypothetical protein